MNYQRPFLLLLALAGVFFAGSCQQATTASVDQPAYEKGSVVPEPKVAANDTIRFLEDRVRRDPDDFIANNKLTSEYLQRLRETGDITYLSLASRTADASLKTLPAEQNKGGLAALTQVEFSSHDFAAAIEHAQRLTELDPYKGYTYQLLGDSLLELGRYDEAEAAFRDMEKFGGVQKMTTVAMKQRLARLAFLHGDTKEAAKHYLDALTLAKSIPDPPKETVAWCQWQLGETAFGIGDHKNAEKYYRESLETFPDYFRSLASLARVRAAQGDVNEAIQLFEKVVRILPDPAFVASLGDLYKVSGRESDAQNQYALVQNIGHLSALNGSLYNRQLALFYADHDLKPDEAYDNAVREYAARRDIYGADAVAWTALKAGKIAEAQAAIKDALKLGTKDAKLFYHAGMIENAAGNKTEAKRQLDLSLKTNPGFDPLQASAAKAVLEAFK